MLFDSHLGDVNNVNNVKRYFQKKCAYNAGNVNTVLNVFCWGGLGARPKKIKTLKTLLTLPAF